MKELSAVGNKRAQKDSQGQKGLTYTAYLELLLGMKADQDCLSRGMDMVETGMRSRPGSDTFSLDHCVHAVEAEIRTTVKGIGSISAKEYRSYEN